MNDVPVHGLRSSLAVWWLLLLLNRVPYGHMGLANSCDRYEDNRLDYIFDHAAAFAAAGSLGVAFGAGAGCMTTAESDNGHFVRRASAYFEAARPPLCGP